MDDLRGLASAARRYSEWPRKIAEAHKAAALAAKAAMEWGACTPGRAAEAVDWLWEPLLGYAHCRGVNTTHCTTESERCEQKHAEHAQLRAGGPRVHRGACTAVRAVMEPVRELAAAGYSALKAGSNWTMSKQRMAGSIRLPTRSM